MVNLDEIEKALTEATPSPWKEGRVTYAVEAEYARFREKKIAAIATVHEQVTLGSPFDWRANAHLIAHAPEWLRLLVEQNKELIARNEELTQKYRGALDRIMDLECDHGNCIREKQGLRRENEKMKGVVEAVKLCERIKSKAQSIGNVEYVNMSKEEVEDCLFALGFQLNMAENKLHRALASLDAKEQDAVASD